MLSLSSFKKNIIVWMILVLILLTFAIRARLASMPLERDEGEYAYIAQLIFHGTPPYQEAFTMKFPGIYLAYSAILSIFGQTDFGIRYGLILVNAGATLLIFLIAREWIHSNPGQKYLKFRQNLQNSVNFVNSVKKTDRHFGLWAAGAYAVLSLSPSMLGIAANAEHFVLLPTLLGIWLIQKAIVDKKMGSFIFFAGICFGIAGCIKQQGIIFSLAGLFLFILHSSSRKQVSYDSLSINSPNDSSPWQGEASPRRSLRRSAGRRGLLRNIHTWYQTSFFGACIIYFLGIAVPFFVMFTWIYQAGVFPQFKFWCLDYAKYYGNMWSWRDGLQHFTFTLFPIIKDHAPLLGISLFGLATSWVYDRKIFWFFAIFLITGLLAAAPGLIFRPHYFLFVTPALALSAGFGMIAFGRWLIFGILALAFPMMIQSQIFFLTNPMIASHLMYPRNAFPEIQDVSCKLRRETKENDRIAVIGSEPQIYFYMQHKAAIPYLYMYPLLEPHPYAARMQKHLMDILSRSPPDYLIHVRIPTSWLVYPNSEISFLEWLPIFLKSQYDKQYSIRTSQISSTSEIVVYHKKT